MSMTLGRASGNSAPIATVATAGAASADCCIPCDIPVFCRNHYYRGKLLTEREFADEQRYFVNKARLHTLALHGWGVACGLHVKPHPYCPELRLVIEEGLAIDACGRDIRVLTEVTIDLPQPPAPPPPPPKTTAPAPDAGKGQPEEPACEPEPPAKTLYLCLAYAECETEFAPAPFDDCGCNAGSARARSIAASQALPAACRSRSSWTWCPAERSPRSRSARMAIAAGSRARKPSTGSCAASSKNSRPNG